MERRKYFFLLSAEKGSDFKAICVLKLPGVAMVGTRHQTSSKAQGRATQVALLVAGCLLIATAGDAFVASRSFQVTTPASQPAPLAGDVKMTQPAGRHASVMSNGQMNLFKAATSVALLCLAAKRMSKSRSSKAPSIRYAAVRMTSTPTIPSTPIDLMQLDQLDEVAPAAQPYAESIPVISMDAEPVAFAPAKPVPLPSVTMPMACAPSVESPSQTSADPLCGKSPARYVAGARRGQGQKRRAASSGRAARRAVGQQLCASLEPCPTSMTFDASKTRTKIQLGLRVSPCMRSEAGRESKVSCGLELSEMGTCRNFVAHDWKVYMLDHELALTDATYSHFGSIDAHSATWEACDVALRTENGK